MFGILGPMAGLAIGPRPIVIGLFMGRQALRGEKERLLAIRRLQARHAHRQVHRRDQLRGEQGLADTLRLVQRRVATSTHPSRRAAPLHRDALAAQLAAKSDEATRTSTLRDVDEQITRIEGLREKVPPAHRRLSCAARATQKAAAAAPRRPGRPRAPTDPPRRRAPCSTGAGPADAGYARATGPVPRPGCGCRQHARPARRAARVAIAGKVKAGKSTLLNALVGEMLAPTDAGECTSSSPGTAGITPGHVWAHLHNGDKVPPDAVSPATTAPSTSSCRIHAARLTISWSVALVALPR